MISLFPAQVETLRQLKDAGTQLGAEIVISIPLSNSGPRHFERDSRSGSDVAREIGCPCKGGLCKTKRNCRSSRRCRSIVAASDLSSCLYCSNSRCAFASSLIRL